MRLLVVAAWLLGACGGGAGVADAPPAPGPEVFDDDAWLRGASEVEPASQRALLLSGSGRPGRHFPYLARYGDIGLVDPVPVHDRGWRYTDERAVARMSGAVDAASVAHLREVLPGALPHPRRVRTIELVNAVRYADPPPTEGPLAVRVEGAPSPILEGRVLVRVSLRAPDLAPLAADRPPAHIVFLVDTSDTMGERSALEVGKAAMHAVVDAMRPGDTVGIVKSGENGRTALAPTDVSAAKPLHEAIDALPRGGEPEAPAEPPEDLFAVNGDLPQDGGLIAVALLADRPPDHLRRIVGITDFDARFVSPDYQPTPDAPSIVGVQVGPGNGVASFSGVEHLVGAMHAIRDAEEARRLVPARVLAERDTVARALRWEVEWNADAIRSWRLVDTWEQRTHPWEVGPNAADVGVGHAVSAVFEVDLAASAGPLGEVRVGWRDPIGGEVAGVTVRIGRDAIAPSLGAASPDLRAAAAAAGLGEVLSASRFAPAVRLEALLPHAAGHEELEGWIRAAMALGAEARVPPGPPPIPNRGAGLPPPSEPLVPPPARIPTRPGLAGPRIDRPAVRMDRASAELDVSGSADAVHTAVTALDAPLLACYRERLEELPSLAGRVEIEWYVEGGRVIGADVFANTTGDPAIGNCTIRAVMAHPFPADVTGEALYPFVFGQAAP